MGIQDFVNQLSSSVLGNIGMSENSPGTLDTGGKSFGALGAFRKDIDRSAQRSYVEDGVIRNIRPRSLEILMQEPDVTVVVKKRMFSSLVENYRMDLMDEKEKLFVRSVKKLFYNKCRAIAAYERLTKIERISSKSGFINDFALPMVFGIIDILDSTPATNNWLDAKTRSTLETIQQVKNLSDVNNFTTWITDKDLPYVTDTGEGTGTFELTMVSSFNTTTSVNLGQGNASLTIEDPYKLMVITNEDIDLAITQAVNKFSQSNFIKLTEFQLGKSIQDLKDKLNSIRIARNASHIRFYVNEETLLYKKIRAVIDEEGREINFTFDAGTFGADLFSPDDNTISLDPSALEGDNGLKGAEVGLLKQILHNMYVLMGLKYTSNSELKIFNEETNYIRKKMRLHFGKKPIIQPMDVVYIYVSSKTRVDTKVTQGLNYSYTDSSLLNQINNTIGSIDNALDDIRRGFGGGKPGEESFIEIEKNSIAGPDFPMWLWTLMRNDFTRQAAGTCVFIGPVADSTHNYINQGKYTLNVSVKDNAHYLDMGQINIKPSVQVWNGALYDPLTPFDLEFDSASGFVRGKTPKLLNENIILLNTGAIRSKLGRYIGQDVSMDKYLKAQDIEPMIYGNAKYGYRRLFHDPDGFVYRWKEGIGSLTVYGSPFSTEVGSFTKDYAPSLTQNPFAGQDVMNVLSLLITGVPYNFNTYVTNAIKMGKINRDDFSNKGNTISFFKGLTNDIREKNSTWGNFIPFKKIILNEKGYNFIISNQFSLGLISLESDLQDKLNERAIKTDQLLQLDTTQDVKSLYTIGAQGQASGSSGISSHSTRSKLIDDIKQLTLDINKKRDGFIKNANTNAFARSIDGGLAIFGNDISYDTSITSESGTAKEIARRRERSEFRKRINYLTQRRLWKVKANEDTNLFIVDDTYDKNFDIQAFEQGIIDVNQFNSTYKNIKEQVNEVRSVLGLEVFADSQGHIQARPPQYNRVPKSVFRAMLQDKAEKGIQLFPEYLERMFFNKLEGITEQLEITEDQIRLRTAALGTANDDDVNSFLSTGFGNFKLLTNEYTGELDWNLDSLFYQDDPEAQEDKFKTTLSNIDAKLKAPLNATVSFSVISQIDILNQTVQEKSDDKMNNRISVISSRLQGRGVPDAPSSRDGILSGLYDKESRFKQADVLKVLNDIGGLVSERQRLIKVLSNTVKNLRQGLNVNSKDSKIVNSILLPNLYQTDNDEDFPEILDHMIEDENIDDLGDGSGKRYVIQDRQIKSLSIKEAGPDYTAVQVDGKLEVGLVEFPSEANISGIAGQSNAIGSAFAVDYDMWRMYGWRSPNAVQAPFFSDPDTQCAPYAVYLLNLARKKIFTANINIVGNEFIQPGEVYYIEDRDILFYSDTVSHSYSYGSDFDTSINLTFGRNPGEYIPTHLDMVGNVLYNNRYRAEQIRHVRHGRADDSTHVSTIVVDKTSRLGTDAVTSLLSGSYGEANRKALSNILLSAGGWFPPSDFGKKLNINVRVYKNSSSAVGIPAVNSYVWSLANEVKSWILNPTKLNISGQSLVVDDSNSGSNNKPNLTDNDITISEVDLNPNVAGSNSPSQEAWSISRGILNSGVQGSLIANVDSSDASYVSQEDKQDGTKQVDEIQAKQINTILCNCIIDIWVVFSEPAPVKEATATTGITAVNSQSSIFTQEEINRYLDIKKALL